VKKKRKSKYLAVMKKEKDVNQTKIVVFVGSFFSHSIAL